MMPGKSSSPLWSMRRKLLRISSLTLREFQPLLRRSWRVDGRAPADISDPCTRDGVGATAPAAGSLSFIVEERVGSLPARGRPRLPADECTWEVGAPSAGVKNQRKLLDGESDHGYVLISEGAGLEGTAVHEQ